MILLLPINLEGKGVHGLENDHKTSSPYLQNSEICGWNSTLFEIIGGGIKLIKNVFLSFYRLVKKYKHKSMDWKGGEGWGWG